MNSNTQDQIVLECCHLAKTFFEPTLKVTVLDDINLSVKLGECVAIVGVSGSGKSTLMHLLGGLDTPTAGSVYVLGQNLAELGDAERGVVRNKVMGFIYQFHHLLPEFTALENVCMPLLIRGLHPKEAAKKSREILGLVGLSKRLKHKPSELSGGERQRTAIARALVTDPKCILADEPTGNLDRKTADKVHKLLMDLHKEIATSIVLVTHDLGMAASMDRVLEIQDGVLMEPRET